MMIGFIILGCIGCHNKIEEIKINGYSMGTTYSIVYVEEGISLENQFLIQNVDSILKHLNQQMSTYIKDSEISRFNSSKSTKPFSISTELSDVIRRAKSIYYQSDGAFDISTLPLTKLWGFGPNQNELHKIPTEDEINTALRNTGMELLIIDENSIQKKHPHIELDLNAIAKGFAVDQICIFLESVGIHNYLVEMGGEIRCNGRNKNRNFWKIGIDKPIQDNQNERVIESILNVTQTSVATSGDYRNFFTVDQTKYSHVINPKTGYPVKNGVASATVIAPTCGEADAWATALLVLGKKGIDILEKIEDYEALIFIRKGNVFKEIMTSGVEELIDKNEKI